MRSYSPISLLHWALFVWSRVAVYMCVFSFFLFFFCVCTTAADQPRQRRGISGDTHLCAVWERNKGRRGRRGQRGGRRDRQAGGKKKKDKNKEARGRERLYPSVPGRQPSAQIRPMGTHSLYTCSNQLATATCLSGGFTLRHTPALVEVGGRSAAEEFSCSASADEDLNMMEERQAECCFGGEWNLHLMLAFIETASCIVCVLCSK